MSTRSEGVVVLVLLLLVVGAAAGLRAGVRQITTLPGPSTSMQQFEVKPGSSLRSVLRALQRQQLIGNARLLEWYLRCCQNAIVHTGATVKVGRYRIVPGQPPIEIVRQLIEGRVVLEHVTIPEGWTFAQMREYLAMQPELRQTLAGRTEAEIMAELGAVDLPAEGRFAPDTYSYAPDVTTDMQILSMAFEAQRHNLQEAWDTRQADLPLATADEALTLASIVEKETGLPSERPRVAGVFINRLRKHMALQSDPTVIYGMGEHYDGNIRKSDLKRDTPYNTYTRAGLPPTPIALPGRKAIAAVLNPERNNYLYFVATGDGGGGHNFSATFVEHQLSVQRYLDRLHAPPSAPAATAGTAPAP